MKVANTANSSLRSRIVTRYASRFLAIHGSTAGDDRVRSQTRPPHRFWWLTLAMFGATLIVVGTFLPFAHVEMVGGSTFNRSDWQMGPNASVTFAGAPILLIDVAILIVGLFAIEGVIGRSTTARRRQSSLAFEFWLMIWTCVSFKSSFPGTWDVPAVVSRGFGGWVSASGIAVLVGVYVAEVRRYGSPRERERPLSDRERLALARAEQRPFLRAIAPVAGGASFALAMKLTGRSWSMVVVGFSAFGALLEWQIRRRLTDLRRRRIAERKEPTSVS